MFSPISDLECFASIDGQARCVVRQTTTAALIASICNRSNQAPRLASGARAWALFRPWRETRQWQQRPDGVFWCQTHRKSELALLCCRLALLSCSWFGKCSGAGAGDVGSRDERGGAVLWLVLVRQKAPLEGVVMINKRRARVQVASPYSRLSDRRPPPPSLAWHDCMHLRGKPDPFLVGCPYPKPPFLFHDETPARWRKPTGAAGEGANPQVRGYWGSGVHWGGPARGSGWSPPLGSAPGHHRPVVFNSGQPAHLAGRR